MELGHQLWVALPEQGVGLDNIQRSPPTSISLRFCDNFLYVVSVLITFPELLEWFFPLFAEFIFLRKKMF